MGDGMRKLTFFTILAFFLDKYAVPIGTVIIQSNGITPLFILPPSPCLTLQSLQFLQTSHGEALPLSPLWRRRSRSTYS